MFTRSALVASLLLLAPTFAACAGDEVHTHDDDHAHDDEATAGFEEAYQQAVLGKDDSGGCSGVVLPDQSGFSKRVALTFDDGPNVTTTTRVLDILRERGIKATFFINGSRVKGAPEKAVLARIIADGHILANHSQNHLNLKTVADAKLRSEVTLTHEIIKAAGVTPRYLRFPFGSASCAGLAFVKTLGYATTGWHVDSADWCFAKSGNGTCSASTFRYVPDVFRMNLEGYVMSQVRAKNGGVVLFHDIHANTVAVLDGLISTLEDEGFSFVNLNDTTYFPRLNGVTPPAVRFVGSPCATDRECNFSSSVASAICYSFSPTAVGFCTLPCEGTCPDKTGASPTFCTSLDSGFTGRCVAKSAAVNESCGRIAGTSPKSAQRFIGTSSATAATATVCLPR